MKTEYLPIVIILLSKHAVESIYHRHILHGHATIFSLILDPIRIPIGLPPNMSTTLGGKWWRVIQAIDKEHKMSISMLKSEALGR